jgi:ubiquinol-cytochrome c reductase cytochrome b subunit
MGLLTRKISAFFEARFDVQTGRELIKKQVYKRLPPHVGLLHTLGSLSLLAFINQVVTGILLLVYYRPTPDEAYDSVRHITGEVSFGWLVRQLHAWGATIMVAAVTLHMMRTYFMGSYKKPRELTWVVGVGLFLLTLVFGFTGYLLPWSQLSYWATTVGTQVARALPGVGPWLQRLMLGGDSVGAETLSRFFTLHAVVLPWILVAAIGLHLFLMRVQNLATLDPVGEERSYPPEAGIPFWPVHVTKEGCVALLLFGALVTLAVLTPWEIGETANPMETPEGIKPEWYFLPTYQLLKYFTGPAGKIAGIAISGVPYVLLFLWPFLDRSKHRHPRKRPFAVSIGILALLIALVFGVLGRLSETRQQFFGRTYEFDVYGVPRLVEPEHKIPASEPGDHATQD